MLATVIGLVLTNLASLAALVFYFQLVQRERAELLQRIQAPQMATVEHAMRDAPPDPLPLPYDDDVAWHENRDELAARLANFENTPY